MVWLSSAVPLIRETFARVAFAQWPGLFDAVSSKMTNDRLDDHRVYATASKQSERANLPNLKSNRRIDGRRMEINANEDGPLDL